MLFSTHFHVEKTSYILFFHAVMNWVRKFVFSSLGFNDLRRVYGEKKSIRKVKIAIYYILWCSIVRSTLNNKHVITANICNLKFNINNIYYSQGVFFFFNFAKPFNHHPPCGQKVFKTFPVLVGKHKRGVAIY